MGDKQKETPPGTAAATLGQVMAAAGMAVGAVVLASVVFPNLTLDGIKNAFTPGPGGGDAIKNFFTSSLGKALAGATAMIGGYVAYNKLDEHKEALKDEYAMPARSECFVDRLDTEEIRRRQALVAARNQTFFSPGGPCQPAPALG